MTMSVFHYHEITNDYVTFDTMYIEGAVTRCCISLKYEEQMPFIWHPLK